MNETFYLNNHMMNDKWAVHETANTHVDTMQDHTHRDKMPSE